MAKALLCQTHTLVSFAAFKTREGNHAQQWRNMATEPGISCQALIRHQACCKNSLPSNSLQVSRVACEGAQRDGLGGFTNQVGQPSTSLFTVPQERFCSLRHRNTKHFRRHSKYDEGPVLDWQWAPSSVIDTDSDEENEGTSKVDVVDDDEDEDRAQVLEDQFNRFAMAMALDDNEMAEQVMQELGNPLRMGEMKELVDGLTELEEQLQELFEEVNRMIEEGDEETARDLIEANYEALLEQCEMGIQGMEQAAMLDTLTQLRMSLGDFEEVERLLEQTNEVLVKVGFDSGQPLVDNVLEHMGSMYAALGKPEEALPFYLKTLANQEELLGKESPLIVKPLLGLANAYSDLDNTSKAIEVYQRVLAIIEKTRGPNDETLALPLSHLGHSLLEEGRVDEAELSLLRALRLVERMWGPHDGRVGVATCALARTKVARGEVDEAVFLYNKGLQIMEGCSKFSDDDPTMETLRTDLAELLNLLERNDEAQELWEQNLLKKEKAVGSNHIQLVVHLQNLASSYAASEKYDKCEPLLRRSLKLVTANLGPNAPQVSIPLECLATALHHLGRSDEAEPLARQALHLRETTYGCHSAIVGEACNCLASILHSLGRNDEAVMLMWRVLAIQERELGPDSPEIELTLELLIMLLHTLGRTSEIPSLVRRVQKLSLDSSVELMPK